MAESREVCLDLWEKYTEPLITFSRYVNNICFWAGKVFEQTIDDEWDTSDADGWTITSKQRKIECPACGVKASEEMFP